MVRSRLILALCATILFLSGCRDVKQEWVDMLSKDGIAIVFAMFCMFVVAPAIGFAIWRMFGWLAIRVETVIKEHTSFTKSVSKSYEAISDCLIILTEKVGSIVDNEPVWHVEDSQKIKDIHSKMSEIHSLVIKRKNNHDNNA